MQCDASINAATYQGYTALHLAAAGGCCEIATLLLACGADPELSTTPPDSAEEGEKPVDLATNDKVRSCLAEFSGRASLG